MDDSADTPRTREPQKRRRLLEQSPRFADSFGLVLLLLIVSFFVLALGGDNVSVQILSMVIVASVTWLALRASQVKRRILRVALALIPLATLIAVVLILEGSDQTATIVSKTLVVLLVVVAPVAILRRLAEHPVISLNTFYGAVCVYLLIAMFFATVFGLIAGISGDPFFAQLQSPADEATSIDYLYFSLVTITTVGYGDLTAATSVGRMAAVFEAVLGQLYLITVVALVVQNLGPQSRVGRRLRAEEEKLQSVSGDGEGAGPDDAEAGEAPDQGA
jgi:hypothetical protein